MGAGLGDGGAEEVVEDAGDVFDGGVDAAVVVELGRVEVEVFVVEACDDGVVDDLFELGDGEEWFAAGVKPGFDGGFKAIVVAVGVEAVALAEEAAIFFGGEARVVEAVGRREVEGDAEEDGSGLVPHDDAMVW